MQVKKSVITLALSCGLMVLPAIAQSSSPSTPPSADPQSPSAAQSGSPSGSMSTTAGQSGSSSADSSKVQSDVQTALQKDSQLAGNSVDVQVSDNKIMLSGTVSSQALKDHAEQIATQTAPSGFTVKNKIKVAGSTGSPSDQQPK